MEEPTCYVFRKSRDRAPKRRRLNNDIPVEHVVRRHDLFRKQWSILERRLDEAVSKAQSTTLCALTSFINTSRERRERGKIPTGLVVIGSSSSANLVDCVETYDSGDQAGASVSLSPADGPNLKTLLKVLIAKVTKNHGDEEEDQDPAVARRSKGRKLLNYDLQILHDWIKARDCPRLVIIVEDSESFDINVLADFISLVHAWLDRLPIVLLIGIATSVDMFHDRMSSSAIKCMQGEAFDLTETTEVLEEAFRCCTASGGATVHLGPQLASSLSQRSKDYMQSIETFKQSIKYALAGHYHGNPATIFLADIPEEQLTPTDFEVIRNLPSFQQNIDARLSRKQAAQARTLLSSNHELLHIIKDSISTTNTNLEWLSGALDAIIAIRAHSSRPPLLYSSLYIKALAGTLTPSSPLIREILLSIRTLNPTATASILETITDTLIRMPPSSHAISPDDFADLSDELAAITSTSTSNTPAQQKPYNHLLTRLHTLLTAYLTATLPTHPLTTTTFCHELLFLDTPHRTLIRGAFTPAPRTAIERALSRPHDYLGCECCAPESHEGQSREGQSREGRSGKGDMWRSGGEGTTQPPTAVLYQLYLESGALINVADLWMAFKARVAPGLGAARRAVGVNGLTEQEVDDGGGEGNGEVDGRRVDGEEGEVKGADVGGGAGGGETSTDERLLRALFFRGLAELKYMGMVKASRRKVDCLQKVLWKGL